MPGKRSHQKRRSGRIVTDKRGEGSVFGPKPRSKRWGIPNEEKRPSLRGGRGPGPREREKVFPRGKKRPNQRSH